MNTHVFDCWSRISAVVAAAALLGSAGCSEKSPDLAGTDLDDTAQVTLALANTPAEVGCVVIQIAGATTIDRRFPNENSNSTFRLTRLPVGVAVFTVEAFSEACPALTPASVATFVGGPVAVTLRPGLNDPFTIFMRRAAQVSVDVDFGAPGAAPTCAAEGSACTLDTHCCSSRCVVPPSSDTGVGACAAPLAPARAIPVTLINNRQHLFYPNGGGDHCPTSGGQIYTVTLQLGQARCLPSPMFDTASAILLSEPNVCEVGAGCRPCEDEACLPSSCFPTAPLAPVGTQCPGRLLGAVVPNTRYLIVIPPGTTQSQAGLPQFFQTTTSEVVSVTPPAGTDSFAMTTLGTRLFPPDATGSCGGGLCGILEFQQYASLGGWSIGFTANNLFYTSAF